jgi:hypothetical protein
MPTAASPRTFPFPSPCAGCQEMFRRDSVSTAPARADLKVHAPLLSPKRAMNTAHIQARPSEKDIGVSANREPRHAGASMPSIRSLVYTYSGRRNHKDLRRIDPRFDPYVSKHLFGAACCPCPQTAIRSIIGVAAQSPSMPYGVVSAQRLLLSRRCLLGFTGRGYSTTHTEVFHSRISTGKPRSTRCTDRSNAYLNANKFYAKTRNAGVCSPAGDKGQHHHGPAPATKNPGLHAPPHSFLGPR